MSIYVQIQQIYRINVNKNLKLNTKSNIDMTMNGSRKKCQ